jgi:hypothetical protein
MSPVPISKVPPYLRTGENNVDIFPLGFFGCFFFPMFCEARLAFPLERNASYFVPNSKLKKLSYKIHSFTFPLKIRCSKQAQSKMGAKKG